MAEIVLNLPDELVERLRAEAERRHTTPESLLAEHVAAYPLQTEVPRQSVASFWGIGAGRPGSHGSVEAVDSYIRELRDEWE